MRHILDKVEVLWNPEGMSRLGVKAAARLSGVDEHRIRVWERRYGAVRPNRTETGRRVYEYSEIERLRKLGMLVEGGWSISEVANLSDRELEPLVESLRQKDAPVVDAPVTGDLSADSTDPEISRLIDLTKQFALSEVGGELSRLRAERGILEFIHSILSPFFGVLGQKVVENEITIAQEHAISAIIRDQLARMIGELRPVENNKVIVTLSTPEGDFHEFGILLAQAICAVVGVKYYYLGSNLPPMPLCDSVKALNADICIVGTSATTVVNPHLKTDQQLATVHECLAKSAKIWVGGAWAQAHPVSRRYRAIATLKELENELRSLIDEKST